MQSFSHHAVGVQQGSEVLFSAFLDSGEMWTGTGARVHRHRIQFKDAFQAPPVVHVALQMWDISGGANQRADIAAENIDPEGFTIVFRTWDDTRVARVRAGWLAIGPTRFDTDWDV